MDVTLLLADNESSRRDVLERFFRQCGFDVVTASNAWECSTGIESFGPDLLVLGPDLPTDDADAVLSLARENRRSTGLPGVLVIGTDSPDALSTRTGVPKASCFQEPVPTEDLLDHVGLIVALIDLNRRSQPRPRRRELDVVHLREKEACLV